MVTGCAGQQAGAVAPTRSNLSGPQASAGEIIRVPRTIVGRTEAASISELYQRAQGKLDAGQVEEAARAFDRVYELDRDGQLAGDALFQAAAAHDAAGQRLAALDRYTELAARFADHRLARTALVRSIRLLAFLERWRRAGQTAELVLMRYTDLRPLERIVALSAKALEHVALGEDKRAADYVERGRDIVEALQLDAAGKLPRDVAQLYFALGEVKRLRAARIQFNPLPSDFADALERRCQLLLDAQSAYSNTMRAYDAHWSSMAGYRVGELYQALHEDLMKVRQPDAAKTQAKRQLFEGAMRLRYSILLRKALDMMVHTLAIAERTGEQSSWTKKSSEAKRLIERAIEREERSIDALPYSRSELQAALDELERRSR